MPVSKIAITIDKSTPMRLNLLVRENKFPNRSRAIQEAPEEKIQRIERNRLERECEKLDPLEEKAHSETGIEFEVHEWPEY